MSRRGVCSRPETGALDADPAGFVLLAFPSERPDHPFMGFKHPGNFLSLRTVEVSVNVAAIWMGF